MALDATLIACVRLIRDDPDFDVQIDGNQDGWASDALNVRISGLGIARQGVDEVRLRASGDVLSERIFGNRTLRLQFTVDANSQTWLASAQEAADDLAAGLSRADVATLLRAENLGVPRCSDIRIVPYRDEHGDWRSAAVFEAVFPWSRRHVPAASVTVDRIGAVEFTGTPITGGQNDPHTIGPETVSEDD
jgi:hypothetical protein